ncbi:tRNA lysidine(34) synthetase TilS [Leptolyngbya sp. CCNP1308]|uniref:tRNA lysidine(34) synthetase TilS n=1 Tax=Leptolyngbya sp. CCNP1308 TaxID=3110255 RepID=UPI002B208EA0|nr:tRNA lysidine(34) synthetase TilS [Leptolyngbya sp. CCNP1308]MEA5447041.1 tRNA lysidine(34) synthetase TilS [Leptolyngbya sp. CCNP1308]
MGLSSMGGVPWSTTHAGVHRLLKIRPLLPQGATGLLAVSGGQDSVCLLKLLVDLRPKWGWQLRAVHCDHRWRADSGANADFVRQLCEGWGVPCEVVTAEADCATEAKARQWRYQVFEELTSRERFTHVVTGHTASDRTETLLYNLLRGSGTDGLQALAWQRPLSQASPIVVVRPLLGLTRQQTGEFCRQFDLPIWEDATNQDTRYARNRIRLELLPYLQEHFNPGVDATLANTAELLTAEVELLEGMAGELYGALVSPPAGNSEGWKIQRSPLKTAPLALQRRVLRRVLQQVTPAQISFEHVEKLVALLVAPQGSQSDPFPGGIIAVVEGDWLVLKPLMIP